jgi:hypothetical protein
MSAKWHAAAKPNPTQPNPTLNPAGALHASASAAAAAAVCVGPLLLHPHWQRAAASMPRRAHTPHFALWTGRISTVQNGVRKLWWQARCRTLPAGMQQQRAHTQQPAPCAATPCAAIPCAAIPCATIPCATIPCAAIPCAAPHTCTAHLYCIGLQAYILCCRPQSATVACM